MTLVIDELYPGVVFTQPFRIQKTVSIGHIRPWLYKHGTPIGSVTLEVYSGATQLASASLPIESVTDAVPGVYGHGRVRFDFDSLTLHHDSTAEYTEFTFKLSVSEHTKDPDNFLGAVRQYEAPVYDYYGDTQEDGTPVNSMISPMGFELFKVGY